MRPLITALLVLATQPSWAMFKCIENGKTSFQETPCANVQGQTVLKPQYTAETPVSAPDAKSRTEVAADALEEERLRREAEYAVRDKRAELARFREQCAAEVRAINDNRFGWNNNLAGATRSQAEAQAAQAQAAACDLQARTLESELAYLRSQCLARKCTLPPL
ncbi:cell division septum initiation protein DivIVA [Variovorax boronicumulans]|uniref:hypothetical protein n=1 Tax=Variovorax boronicumulans TaxID=436515 RepID=UPI00278A6B6F|nr:hypothetical protein [Variovorax boronicumulans]MDP9919043.1 cell division septum initiation protein DivIVA [Variovorax boronicumulans]